MSAPAVPDRFATVDALRGVAALAVMLFHADIGGVFAFHGGYLAVDLFFALSGFVIAHSYAPRLGAGMGFAQFMRLRVARLWPMLLVGALLGIVLHGGHAGMLFLLPNPLSPTMLYPANPPFWSLLLEMIAYAALALLWGRIGARGLLAIIAASAAVLVFSARGAVPIEGLGAQWDAFWPGLARLGFAFGIGVAIWHLRRHRTQRRRSMGAWLIPAAFAAIAGIIGQGDGAALAVILLAVPALTWLATCWEVPHRRAAAVLGDLSYPLYCIHVPLLATAAGLGLEIAMLCALPVAALWLDRAVDARARAAFKRWLAPRKPAVSAA